MDLLLFALTIKKKTNFIFLLLLLQKKLITDWSKVIKTFPLQQLNKHGTVHFEKGTIVAAHHSVNHSTISIAGQ